jgi:hypothetical protein
MTHDYKRHGTTTLFAALSVLDGAVIGRCMQHHRHIEFIRFLNTVEREAAANKSIHVVLDNYATHKALIASCRSTTERKTPRRMRYRVILEKKFSTALSQDAEVGVK